MLPWAQEASELQIVESRRLILESYGFVLVPVRCSTLAVLWGVVVVGMPT